MNRAMDDQIKSKEQLIKELEDLQQMYDSLKAISDADIDRLKVTEQKLSKLEHRNRAWLENSPVCTQIVDLDFKLQYMSDVGIKGHQIDDVTSYYGKTYPFHFYPESFITEMTGKMLSAIETGKVITQEDPVVDVNGHELWYHSTIVPVKDTTDRVEYLMIVSVDTTSQKIAERTIYQSEKKYKQLFETLSEGVALNEVIYNDQGEMVDYRILEVNSAFYTTALYDGPVLGRLATDLYQLPVEFITSFWR